MYVLKHNFNDFIVEEILREDLLVENGFSSAYHVYELKKQNYTTERAVTHIAKALHLPRKFIGYAGSKDKNAITTQYITIKGVKKDKILALELKDIKLSFVGYAKEAFKLGDLLGNQFVITIRNLDEVFSKNIPKDFVIPNYFDEQRFSSCNAAIGQALFTQDFRKAIQLVVDNDKDFAHIIIEYLKTHENDFIGALHRLPRKTVLFYAHAVQSKLYNQLLAQEVESWSVQAKKIIYSEGYFVFSQDPFLEESKVFPEYIPLIGYGTESDPVIDDVLEKMGLKTRSFLIKALPEISLEGDMRKSFVNVTDFKLVTCENDADHPGKYVCTVEFNLPKGSYATIVVRQLFG